MSEAGRRAITLQTVFVLAALVVAPGQAQPPCAGGEIHAATLTRASLDRPLGDYVEQLRSTLDEPAWLAYPVPLVQGVGRLCCHRRCDSGWAGHACRLESRHRSTSLSDEDDRAWGGSGVARVLWRIADGRVTEIRAYSDDCPLDAGGRDVYLLEGVDPEESVALLEATVRTGSTASSGLEDDALMALAMHAGRDADAALIRLSRSAAPREVREHVAFWLGSTRGRAGFVRLSEMLEEESDGEVLEQVVFGMSLSKEPGADDRLIATARQHERGKVRSQALFWLAQKAHRQAGEALGRAVTDDPDAEVREHAVFAVSQLPDGEAVPLLIELARTNPHPEVRRAALFWLGQSDDPRALDLFEELLSD